MSKRRRRNRNPLLKRKFDEGYELGKVHGIEQAVSYFAKDFERMKNTKGIGPATMQKVREALGEKYFKEE